MRFPRMVFLIGLCGAGAALAQGTPPPATSPAQQRIDADELRDVIRANGVATDKLTPRVEQGRVTLTGEVPSYDDKLRAEEAVSRIRGVTAVKNELVVAGGAVPDETLQANVQRALKSDPATDEYQVTVAVNDGVARLSGSVDSFQEKLLAARIAGRVDGVRDVENEVTVREPARRDDAALTADVEQRLRYDNRLQDDRVKVGAAAGKVVLWGEVNSLFDKAAAVVHAYAAGARDVDAEGLSVERVEEDRSQTASGQGTDLKSEAITKAIEVALSADPRVKGQNVVVVVNDGVATLTGTVDNLPAKQAALDNARAVIGVQRAVDRLQVKATKIGDATIKAAMTRSILDEPGLEEGEVTASVSKGRVTLRGRVDSVDERRRAVDAASAIAGVIALDERIEIERTAATKTDDELETSIERQIFWSPYVDANQVDVSVSDGVARLTGDVDSWFEKEQAEENAMQAGAFRVDNRLRVAPGAGPPATP